MKDVLLERFARKSAIVGIVGLGYVGLPLALRFSEVGFKVIGFDVDLTKVDLINRGLSPIEHITPAMVAKAGAKGLEATGDLSRANEADVLILCVPTPLDKHREPDLSFVIGTMDALVPHLRPGQAVSLESTTYPGTTEEELRPRLEAANLRVGDDVFLIYSPEREDPGNRDFSTHSIPKVVGGSTTACLEVGEAIYGSVIDQVVPVSSTQVAELTKLLENIHRAVNIGLVNEMKIVADRMGLDIHEVITAAATKPFGFVPYQPGPGLGGHCIPIDPFYLTWKAREYGVNTRFIELAGEVNSAMPAYVVGKVSAALNDRQKAVRGSRILLLGVAYKKNVDDMRESPSLLLIQQLRELGAQVDYSDPHVPHFRGTRQHSYAMDSVALTPQTLADYDCVLLATDHDEFDYEMMEKSATLIVDTRGKYRRPASHIVKA